MYSCNVTRLNFVIEKVSGKVPYIQFVLKWLITNLTFDYILWDYKQTNKSSLNMLQGFTAI